MTRQFAKNSKKGNTTGKARKKLSTSVKSTNCIGKIEEEFIEFLIFSLDLLLLIVFDYLNSFFFCFGIYLYIYVS